MQNIFMRKINVDIEFKVLWFYLDSKEKYPVYNKKCKNWVCWSKNLVKVHVYKYSG